MTVSPSHPSHSRQGFGLVVVAALFIAFSVVAAVLIEKATITQQISRRDATHEQLRRLSDAIIAYSVFNKTGNYTRYPCPALPLLPQTDADFGKEASIDAGYARDCSDTTGDTATATSEGLEILSGATTPNVLRGMVPITTLSQYGANAADAFDPWGGRIMYVVNRNLTNPASPASDQSNNPTLTDKRTNYSLASPDFILISYGRDGMGSIHRDNTDTSSLANAIGIDCTNSTAARIHNENCDDDDTFWWQPAFTSPKAAANAGTSGTAYGTAYFDDILVWYRR